MSDPSIHPGPGGRAQSSAARLATSGEAFERGEAVDTCAQATVQHRRSLGDRLLSQIDESKPTANGSGSGRIIGTSGATRATWLVPQADTFIVHQLAPESQALRSSPWSGQCDNLGAGEVTVLDLEDTEGPMRLPPFVGG
jgi:hypothetical protein